MKLHYVFLIADRLFCALVCAAALVIVIVNFYLKRWGVAIPMLFGLVFLIWTTALHLGYIRRNNRSDQ